MNGGEKRYLNKIASDFANRLVKLETQFNERWDAHDKRSDEIWKDIKSKIDRICNRTNDLPERMKGMQTRISWLYFAFTIIVIGGIVLGLWVKG